MTAFSKIISQNILHSTKIQVMCATAITPQTTILLTPTTEASSGSSITSVEKVSSLAADSLAKFVNHRLFDSNLLTVIRQFNDQSSTFTTFFECCLSKSKGMIPKDVRPSIRPLLNVSDLSENNKWLLETALEYRQFSRIIRDQILKMCDWEPTPENRKNWETMLRGFLSKENLPLEDGGQRVCAAATKGHFELVQALLEKGLIKEFRPEWTIVQVGVFGHLTINYVKIIKLLLDMGPISNETRNWAIDRILQ